MKIKYSNLLVSLLVPFGYMHAQEVSLTPPNAKAGECYARVVSPAQYKDIEEKVLVKEASEEITVVPAEYNMVEESIEIMPAVKHLKVIPAQYKKVTETMEVKPARTVWKTSLNKKRALPVNPKVLSFVKESGIDVAQAQPGDCYKEYFTPSKFKVMTKDILVKNEHNVTMVIDPEFETVEQNITIKPASKKLIEVPPVYEEVEEKVLIEPEKTVWKKGQNPAQKVSGATGEIMCLVKVPAKYKTIKKRVLRAAATTKVVEIPAVTKMIKVKKLISDTQMKKDLKLAVYKTIEKVELENNATFVWHYASDVVEAPQKYTGHQICLVEEPAQTSEVIKTVIDVPEAIEEEVIPAQEKVVSVKKMVVPAKEVKTPIEAEYRMVQKREKISDTHIEWKRILCQTNMTKEIIGKLQSALNDKGYTAGKPDGVLGRGSRRALDKFQRDSGLATGGITYETLSALGITL